VAKKGLKRKAGDPKIAAVRKGPQRQPMPRGVSSVSQVLRLSKNNHRETFIRKRGEKTRKSNIALRGEKKVLRGAEGRSSMPRRGGKRAEKRKAGCEKEGTIAG